MKTTYFSRTAGLILIALVIGLLAGCATSKEDWDSRVGHYTTDQAKADMGAPERSSAVPGGGTSEEWIMHFGATQPPTAGMGTQTGVRAGNVDQPVVQGGAVPLRNEYLRLTFDASGTLVKWERVYR